MDMGQPADEGMLADGSTSPDTLKRTSSNDDTSIKEGVSAEGAGLDKVNRPDQVGDACDVTRVMSIIYLMIITMTNRNVRVRLRRLLAQK